MVFAALSWQAPPATTTFNALSKHSLMAALAQDGCHDKVVAMAIILPHLLIMYSPVDTQQAFKLHMSSTIDMRFKQERAIMC